MDTGDHDDPFAPSTSTSNAQDNGSTSNSGHAGGTRPLTATDIGAQTGARQLSNLEKAMALTSPVIERANPLGMHVVSKQRRKSKTGTAAPSKDAVTSPTSVDRHGKGKAAANGEDTNESSGSSDEVALEPREAIRQQFQVSSGQTLGLFIETYSPLYGIYIGFQCTPKDSEYLNT